MDDKNKFISFDIETLDITINTTLFPPEKKDQNMHYSQPFLRTTIVQL